MPVNITVYRPDQIGGCITVIENNGRKLIIDLGANLPGEDDDVDELAAYGPVGEITRGADAIMYTHYHSDHIGLQRYLPPELRGRQWIGKTAKKVLLWSHSNKPSAGWWKTQLEQMNEYSAPTPVTIADTFVVTPYYVSHGAADSNMLCVDTGGLRIVHTGDYRGHGYLSKGLDSVLERIGRVDVLITEGTMIRSGQSEPVLTEDELKKQMAEIMRQYKFVFVLAGAMDKERMATIHQANLEAAPGRAFVVDAHQAGFLDIVTDEIRTLRENAKAGAIVKGKLFDFSDIQRVVLGPDALQKYGDSGFCMIVHGSQQYRECISATLAGMSDEQRKQAVLVYSMWPGYIGMDSAARIDDYVRVCLLFPRRHVKTLHTSGHADPATIAKVCTRLNPSLAIIPIHRDKEADFEALDIDKQLKSKILTGNKKFSDRVRITLK